MNSKNNFLIILRFIGTNYHGWQIQSNALTIQEVFQRALFSITKSVPEIKGCSRTDRGVHANMYCVNARLKFWIPPGCLTLALNKLLPDDISVTDCFVVDDSFHARYSCAAKEYSYKIYNHRIRDPFWHGRSMHYWYPINLDLIKFSASKLAGTHDFTSFCSLDSRDQNNMIRTIYDFNINKTKNIVEFIIKADGFLYNMVRIIIGTMIDINRGRIDTSDIPKIIAAKNRKRAGPTAPACGLYLNKVFYDGLELT